MPTVNMYFKDEEYEQLVLLRQKLNKQDIREVLKFAAKDLYTREFPPVKEEPKNVE